jgi:hypothetical protein
MIGNPMNTNENFSILHPDGYRFSVIDHVIKGGPFDGFNCSAAGARHFHPDTNETCLSLILKSDKRLVATEMIGD